MYLSVPLGSAALTASPGFTSLIDVLGRGCDTTVADTPLDESALRVLEGGFDGEPTVELNALAVPSGRPLGRWLIALALLLMGLEIALSRTFTRVGSGS